MRAVSIVAVKAAFGASLALGFMLAPGAQAIGPDEDSPGWSCVDNGNHICGPGNSEGKPAACYDTGGVIVALWPCRVVIDPVTGDSDVYTDDPNIPTSVY